MYPNFLRAQLRKLIDGTHKVTIDGVSVSKYPNLKGYFEKVERGDHPRTVLEDFVKKNIAGRRYKMRLRIDGIEKSYSVHVLSNLGSHAPSTFLHLDKEVQKEIAKKAIIGLYKIDDVLQNGIKSRPHKPNESHQGWEFVTVKKSIQDDEGNPFNFIAEIRIPSELILDNPRLHAINPEGSDTYRDAAARMVQFKLKDGDSATITVMSSKDIQEEDYAIAEENRKKEEIKAMRRAEEAANVAKKKMKEEMAKARREELERVAIERITNNAFRNSGR